MRAGRRMLDRIFRTRLGERSTFAVVRLWSSALAGSGAPADSVRALLRLEALLFSRIDVLAVDLDDGVHAKHRIIRYHDFFVDRVAPGERVLDVGCGKGELAHDLATRGGAAVTGIDISPSSLAFARARFGADVDFVQADARTWEAHEPFETIVLSNVLEHIEERVVFLRRLVETTGARRLLVRVPVLERDWAVGLRRELDLPYFSDPTHYTEYDRDQLERELQAAGLELEEVVQRWGELWGVARRVGG